MHSNATKTYIPSTQGLYLMTKLLTKLTQDVSLRRGLFIVLTMVGILGGLVAYLALSNLGLWGPGLLTLLIVTLPLTLLWPDGERESHKKSDQRVSVERLWGEGADSLETQCPHCGRLITILCRAVSPISSTLRPSKLLKRSRTQH